MLLAYGGGGYVGLPLMHLCQSTRISASPLLDRVEIPHGWRNKYEIGDRRRRYSETRPQDGGT
jgi:hypothetical protein